MVPTDADPPKADPKKWEDDPDEPPALPPPATEAGAPQASKLNTVLQPDPTSWRPLPPFERVDLKHPDEEMMGRASGVRLAVFGGTSSGKSFLFWSLIHRTWDPRQSGALSTYLEKSLVFKSDRRITDMTGCELVNRHDVLAKFRKHSVLGPTQITDQKWYRLRLAFRRGFFRKNLQMVDVDFYEGRGEAFTMPVEAKRLMKILGDATVVVFCLPLWAAFPDPELLFDERFATERATALNEFGLILHHYNNYYHERVHKSDVRIIVALTMADDNRSALASVRRHWIAPLRDGSDSATGALRRVGRRRRHQVEAAARLRTGRGLVQYLANARALSDELRDRFENETDRSVSTTLSALNFGGRKPWVIPVSAVDGALLAASEARGTTAEPEPVHVELPLFVALCEEYNLLM